MVWTSVTVAATDVVGIGPVEPEDHPILVVDSDGVTPGQIPHECVASSPSERITASSTASVLSTCAAVRAGP